MALVRGLNFRSNLVSASTVPYYQPHSVRRLFFLVLIAALVAYAFVRWNGPGSKQRVPERYTPASGPVIDMKDVQVLAALDAEYTRLIDAVMPSVVAITTSRRVRAPQVVDPMDFYFGQRRRGTEKTQSGLGSGVIVSAEGHILTNHHVISGMEEIRVQLTDGRIEPAQLIGSDPGVDIAVLRVNASGLKPLPLGDSDAVRVGQMVFAIGNPFGLQETVTQGIISAKNRAIRDTAVELIQTDAAVNPGNSGGPLLNLRGEIIGINSAIYSETGGWLGISFAVPANTAQRALVSITKTGRVVRGYLGVTMMELNPSLAREFGLKESRGALVTDVVPGSPAATAGLRSGDVITRLNGREIKNTGELKSRVAEAGVGAKVEVGIVRDGQETTVALEIAEMPSDLSPLRVPPAPQPADPSRPPPQGALPPDRGAGNVLAGLVVGEISPELRGMLPKNIQGVMITRIQPDAPAAERLRVGDVIEEVNQQPISSPEAWEQAVRAIPAGERALLFVCRGRARSFVVVTP